MAMPPIMEKLLNLQKKVDELEAWRCRGRDRAGLAAGKLHVGRRLPCAF